jgi:hypothetical protein
MDGTPTVTPQLAGAQYPFPGSPSPTDQVQLAPNPQPNPQDVQGILAQPQAAPDAPQTTTIPVDPELHAAAVHHNRLAQTLHNIVDAVGGILGGNQTVHLTKDTDGNVTVTHEPSTTGEKWGRVISAALQGAAQGFGAGGGPQGAGNAAKAGFQSGFAAPQQQQQQAEQEAQSANDASEKQQLFNANKALLQQQIAMNTFNLDQMHSSLVDAMTKRANDSQAWIMANPSNKFLGVVTDPSELPTFEANNADMLHNMTHGMYHTEMQLGPNGKPQIAVYGVDQAWMDQKNDKPVTYSILIPGDKLTDPMKLGEKTIPAGQMTNGDISIAKEAETKKIGDYGLKLQKLQGDQQTAQATAQYRADTLRQRGLVGQSEIAKNYSEAAKNRAGAIPNTPAPAGSYDPDFPPPQNFPPGTPGVGHPDKQGNYKVPAAVTTRAQWASNIMENATALNQLVSKRPELLGAGGGRMSTIQQMIGDPDPDIQAIGSRVSNLAQALIGIHGSRSGQNREEVENLLLNKYKNGPGAVAAALKADTDSAHTFLTDERNFQTYGTRTGPNRQYATHPTPAAAPNATAPNPTAPNVPSGQPAVQPGAANTNPVLGNGQGQYIQYDPQQRKYVDVPAPR